MLLDLLYTRRSIRQFTDQQLTSSQIDRLKESILLAPSSRGKQPWQFIFVTNKQIIDKLAQAKTKGSAFIANSALAVVICADTSCSDVWIEDCAIAATCLQLAAAEMGLGSCWAQMRLRPHDADTSASDFICDLLKLPENMEVDNIIGVGYPAEEKDPYPTAQLAWSHIKEIK